MRVTLNLCTFIGHAYRQEGYTHDIPGYPIEYDVDEWCDRCEDMDANTIPLYVRCLWHKIRLFRLFGYGSSLHL